MGVQSPGISLLLSGSRCELYKGGWTRRLIVARRKIHHACLPSAQPDLRKTRYLATNNYNTADPDSTVEKFLAYVGIRWTNQANLSKGLVSCVLLVVSFDTTGYCQYSLNLLQSFAILTAILRRMAFFAILFCHTLSSYFSVILFCHTLLPYFLIATFVLYPIMYPLQCFAALPLPHPAAATLAGICCYESFAAFWSALCRI